MNGSALKMKIELINKNIMKAALNQARADSSQHARRFASLLQLYGERRELVHSLSAVTARK
jgi:polyribonucleotide nucleotidyltransferase